MLQRIIAELRHHIPFTVLGAVTGIVAIIIIVAVGALPSVSDVSETVFYVLHPLHVVLSAGVTTAMYRKYTRGRLIPAILVGYFGSIGVATLSDSVVPYIGELLLDLPHAEAHIGFIEEWQIVNPAAFLGIAVGFWRPGTRFPHAGHVLVSTWASLFYFTAFGVADWIPLLPFVFIFLFLAVWLPCCVSDIVYPLLWAGNGHERHH